MMTLPSPRLSILSLLACLTASAAWAQTLSQPLGTPPQPFGPQPPGVPSLSQSPPPPLSLKQVVVSAGAVFSDSNEPIRSGLVWRVFEDKGDTSQPAIV